MENEYDEIDYDGVESEASDNHESTASEVDQVAALLLDAEGDEESAGQVRDKAKTKIYDSDGTAKNNTKTWTSTPIDRHGNREFGGDDSNLREKASDGARDTIYHAQVQEAQDTAVRMWEQAHRENQRLTEQFESGQISYEDYYRQTHAAGMQAGQARTLAMQARISELEHGQQLQEQHQALERAMGDGWAPENRQQTIRDIRDWATNAGIPMETLANVETESEAMAIYNAMKNEKELETTKMELKAAKAMLKKQHKELGRGRKRAAKSRNMGNRHGGPVGEAQLEEIADLIFGGGK